MSTGTRRPAAENASASAGPVGRNQQRLMRTLPAAPSWPSASRERNVALERSGDRYPVEDRDGRPMAHGEHALEHAACFVLAVDALAIGQAADTGQGCERSVDDAQHLPERDVGSGLQKGVATAAPAPALHQAVVLEIEQDLLQKLPWDLVLGRDLGDQHGFTPRRLRQGTSRARRAYLAFCESMSRT